MRKPLPETDALQQHPVVCAIRQRLDRQFTDRRFLLACSGGLDSLTLAAIFNLLCPGRLRLVHVNHQLQPQADNWQTMVEEWAGRHLIPVLSLKVDVSPAGNLEANARHARYAAIARHIAKDEVLVLGHNLTDQIETFFMRLFRASGLHGLSGMEQVSVREGMQIWRPLLEFTREDYQDLTAFFALQPVTDPMNTDEGFDRVWLRQQLLPLLARRKPEALQNISLGMGYLRQAAILLQTLTSDITADPHRLKIIDVVSCAPEIRQQLVYQWLLEAGLRPPSHSVVSQVCSQLIGGRSDSNAEIYWNPYTLRQYDGYIWLCPPAHLPIGPTQVPLYQLLSPGKSERGFWPFTVSAPFKTWYFPVKPVRPPLRHSPMVPQFPGLHLQLRPRTGGEKILLNPAVGHQSLKKLLQARKIPPWQRQQVGVVSLLTQNNSQIQAVLLPDGQLLVAHNACLWFNPLPLPPSS